MFYDTIWQPVVYWRCYHRYVREKLVPVVRRKDQIEQIYKTSIRVDNRNVDVFFLSNNVNQDC